jgi:hypothetical protein
MLLEVFFEVLAPYLYRAAQAYARDLSAAQAPVDPALAHTKLLAQLRDREQLLATVLFFFLRVQRSFPGDALQELHEGALQLLGGLVVSL